MSARPVCRVRISGRPLKERCGKNSSGKGDFVSIDRHQVRSVGYFGRRCYRDGLEAGAPSAQHDKNLNSTNTFKTAVGAAASFFSNFFDAPPEKRLSPNF